MTATSSTSPTSTSDLVRFLLSRLDDDLAGLKKFNRRSQPVPADLPSVERLRADAEARRQVIGALQQLFVLRDQPFEKAIRHQAVYMLRALATPYADHTGYRTEWALSAPIE